MYVIVAIPAFFMDLEAITKLISMGNLFMYSFVTCCGLAQRYRDRHAQSEISPVEYNIWSFLVISLVAVIAMIKNVVFYYSFPLMGLSIGLMLKLMTLRQTNKPTAEQYTMPWVPLLPCLGIYGNNALIGAFDGQTFVNYLVFTIIGIAIYLFYGLKHSKLEEHANETEGCSAVVEEE